MLNEYTVQNLQEFRTEFYTKGYEIGMEFDSNYLDAFIFSYGDVHSALKEAVIETTKYMTLLQMIPTTHSKYS